MQRRVLRTWTRRVGRGLAGAALAAAVGCAAKVPAPPANVTPHFPEFLYPDVPPQVANTPLGARQRDALPTRQKAVQTGRRGGVDEQRVQRGAQVAGGGVVRLSGCAGGHDRTS